MVREAPRHEPHPLTEAEREAVCICPPWVITARQERRREDHTYACDETSATVDRIIAERERAARAEALRDAAEEQHRMRNSPRALGSKAVNFKRLIFATWLEERADREQQGR